MLEIVLNLGFIAFIAWVILRAMVPRRPEAWESHCAHDPVFLVTGGDASGYVMRRWRENRWEYRRMTEEERRVSSEIAVW